MPASRRATRVRQRNRYRAGKPAIPLRKGPKVSLHLTRSSSSAVAVLALARKSLLALNKEVVKNASPRFSPDGQRLALDPDSGADLWTLPLDVSDPEHPKP